MKKTLVMAMAMALGVTASAYAANPFSDVPAGHWAYDSIAKLAAAGVIDGYGDTTFKGDRLMTRYEMAQIVAKAMAKGANVDKLAAEFADELDALGVRVAALEKKADNVKIIGQIRYSYKDTKQEFGIGDDKKSVESRLRTRLIFTGKVNDNWDFVSRLENNQYFNKDDSETTVGYIGGGEKVTKTTSYDYTGEDTDVKINRAFLTGRLGGVRVDAGRAGLWLADGMVYDDTFDGISLKYGGKNYNLMGWYGKLTESKANGYDVDDPVDNGWGINADVDLGEAVNLFAGYNTVEFDEDTVALYGGEALDDDKLDITHAGLKWDISDDVALTGAYMHTSAEDEENGWYAILDLWGASYSKPGSFGFQAVYYDEPAGAALSHTMNGEYGAKYAADRSKDGVSGALWADGFKGYSVAASYTVAKNMMASVKYYDLKSRSDDDQKAKTFWGEFQLRF
ncbi:MAG: S-layer homology domain-containing protein [Succiniclasticum sp.]|jgi:hypothetical protein